MLGKHSLPFVPRLPELLALEGSYDGIILSCRHKDILRCSDTSHFTSCFKPSGTSELQPVLYCYRPEVCIIGIKDNSGAWKGRVFGFYIKGENRINLARIYGNGLCIYDIVKKVKVGSLIFSETYGDVYFPLPD